MESKELLHRARIWSARDPDEQTRAELQALVAAEDFAQLAARLAGRLEFGTAGLRGVLGAGPLRMNRLVVRETSAGLAAYLAQQVPDAAERGVVVGFDGRRLSREFAQDTAATLAGAGLRVLAFDGVVPTPLVAYAVRALGAAAGVMVTASHNPPAYNGYKVYWGNGAQIIPPHDTGIAAAIVAASQRDLPPCDLKAARASGAVVPIGPELAERYLAGVAGLAVRPATPARAALKIAYTPLHGVGAPLAERALAAAGFVQVRTVASQREPDGAFPTVTFPNPEEPGAMDLVLALAREGDADLACANDPDADRLAVAVREGPGRYRQLTGDQVGALLGAEYLAARPADGVVGCSIVSSRLLGVMAEAAGVAHYQSLTGFKWIANVGLQHEARGRRVLFGYEEALGYTIGGLVRDKDGISALVALCQLAAACKEQGQTLLERLAELYRAHGLYLTRQKSLALDGRRAGPPLGQVLRQAPPARIAGQVVSRWLDLAAGAVHHADGRTTAIELPPSDVLIYELADGSRVIVRPSGTEPKLKCYYEVVDRLGADEPLAAGEARAEARLQAIMQAHQGELAALGA